MKINRTIVIISSIILVAGTVTFIHATKPKNYEECVIKNIKGVESDRAASIVAATCRKKFPEAGNYFDQFDKHKN